MDDRDRIRWDDGEADHESVDSDAPPTRGKRTLALVVFAVFLITIVLCCVAAGEAGQLFWLEPPPP